MSLDERLREELQRAVAQGQVREDDAFDDVRLRHRRGLVRRSVTRQTLAAAVVLTLFASVAMVVSWRNGPDHTGIAAQSEGRFRSTATVRVAPAPTSGSTSTTISRPFKLVDPRTLALAPSIRRAALVSAQRSPDDSSIDFRATLNPTSDLLYLTATAPSGSESTAVTREWAAAFAKARRTEAIESRRATDSVLARRVAALHKQLNAVDAELIRIDPETYAALKPPYHYGYGLSSGPIHGGEADPVSPPASASARERNLWNERVRLLRELADIGVEYARRQIAADALTPQIFSIVIAQTPAVRIDESSPATAPVLVGWAIGLVILLAATILVYRRRTRTTRQVSA